LPSLLELAVKAHEGGHHDKAFLLFQKGAASGDAEMINWLGTFHEAGLGTQKNAELARMLYRRAWKIDRQAHYASNLGDLYLKERKFTHAKIWFRKAVALKDGDATVELVKIYLGQGKRADPRKAAELLKVAADSRNITPTGKDEAVHLLQKRRAQEPNRKQR
jgi:TPR repeat protein